MPGIFVSYAALIAYVGFLLAFWVLAYVFVRLVVWAFHCLSVSLGGH